MLSKTISHGRGKATIAASLAVSSLALGGCATASYAGIPLATGHADAELQSLARRAQAGDKNAQRELGMRYEKGRGVETDLHRAMHLYKLAASPSGETLWVYSPPVLGAPGRVIPINLGVSSPALPEAANRLRALKRMGVR